MRGDDHARIPYEIFYAYPSIVRNVSLSILKKYSMASNARIPNDYYQDLISECYIYYLETSLIYKEVIEQYPPKRQFGYLRKAMINMWRDSVSRNIKREKSEPILFHHIDREYEEIDIDTELLHRKRKVVELAKLLIGEEVDEDNVVVFIQRLKGREANDTKLSRVLEQSLIEEMESIEERLSSQVSNYSISEEGKVEAKKNRGLYNDKSWTTERNPESVLSHIRQAITEKGLYDIKDIRLYLHNKGVIFTEKRNSLDNQIRRAFKSLGMERPKSKRLHKNASLNAHIHACMAKGMIQREIVASIEKHREGFDFDSSINLKNHVKSTYFKQKYKLEKQEHRKEHPAPSASPTGLALTEKVLISIGLSKGELKTIREKTIRADVPLKTLTRRVIRQIIHNTAPPRTITKGMSKHFPRYIHLLEAIPEEVDMDNECITHAHHYLETIKKHFHQREERSS